MYNLIFVLGMVRRSDSLKLWPEGPIALIRMSMSPREWVRLVGVYLRSWSLGLEGMSKVEGLASERVRRIMELKEAMKGVLRRAVVMCFPRWPVPPAMAIVGFGGIVYRNWKGVGGFEIGD